MQVAQWGAITTDASLSKCISCTRYKAKCGPTAATPAATAAAVAATSSTTIAVSTIGEHFVYDSVDERSRGVRDMAISAMSLEQLLSSALRAQKSAAEAKRVVQHLARKA